MVRLILAELTVRLRNLVSDIPDASVMLNEILFAALIVAVCLLLHVAALVLMAEWLLSRVPRGDYLRRTSTPMENATVLILVFSAIIFLHIIETSLWAVFYYASSLFKDFETSLYFSLTSYTTIGYGDVLLPQRWRLLGAIEGISGVLLCGISTAFIFAVMTAIFQSRLRQQPTL